MRASTWKTAIIPVLFAGVPFFLACDAPDRPGQPGVGGQPGMEGQPTPPGMEAQPGQPTADVSDEDIRTMAEVFVALTEVQAETDARAEIAATPEEANQIQAEANDEMQAVLEEHDMTIDEYQRMVQLLNTDERARQRFEQALADIQG
jgi:hypothetical protein